MLGVFLLHLLEFTEKVRLLGFLSIVVEHDFEVVKAEILVEEVLLVVGEVRTVDHLTIH
jgi:hypothetical protein